jgi:tetratricopeptide (TPR) repeat protein
MKNLKLIVPFLFFPLNIFGQITAEELNKLLERGNETQLVGENSRLLQEGYFYSADLIAEKLLQLNPNSANYNYRKGFGLLKLRKNTPGVVAFLEKAITDIDALYDAYSSNEKSAPVDAYFHLGEAYHLNESFEKAIEMYSLFISKSQKKSELIPVTKTKIAQCNNGIESMKKRSNAKLKNLGNSVNTEFADYSPVVSLDGSVLYYTSKRPWPNGESDSYKNPQLNEYPEDIYVSYMNLSDSSWENPTRLNFCTAERNEASLAVSADERKIFIYSDSTGLGDIYYSDFYSNKFNSISRLEDENINSASFESHGMVSHNNSLLIFASDRPGGYGGLDIYMCKRTKDNKWSTPENLGPTINSIANEDAPFISIDDRRLFFTSDGDRSIGGYDIFVADLKDNGSWSVPRNLGYPINSVDDDLFYTTTIDGSRGYLTSRRNGGYGETDVYEIFNDELGVKNLLVFNGIIRTSDNSPLPEDFALSIKLTCPDCKDADRNKIIYPRLRDGKFMTGIKPCSAYSIVYSNATESKELLNELVKTDCTEPYENIERELILDVPTRTLKFKPKEIIEIPEVAINAFANPEFNHFFDYNKNKLRVQKGDLKNYMNELEDQARNGRTKFTISIYSSASTVPTKKFESNEDLARTRAENIKYDLLEYIENQPDLKGKVNVVIAKASVEGPVFENDASNKDKYRQFQYVRLKTE